MPHTLPVQSGTHWQAPPMHCQSLTQAPHALPQPSGPQTLPSHSGTHTQAPPWHVWVAGQLPQLPPHPSLPHWALWQAGSQHWPR